MHKDSLVLLIEILAALFDHFLRHIRHSQIIKALVTATRGGFVIFPHDVHHLFKVMHIFRLLDKHVALCLGYRQALILFLCFTAFIRIDGSGSIVLSVHFPSDSHLAQDQTIRKLALLIEHLNMVLNHTIINYLRLKSDLCQSLLLKLFNKIGLVLIFARILETLLMAAHFIIAYLHYELDIVLNYHMQKVTNGVLLGGTCSD